MFSFAEKIKKMGTMLLHWKDRKSETIRTRKTFCHVILKTDN